MDQLLGNRTDRHRAGDPPGAAPLGTATGAVLGLAAASFVVLLIWAGSRGFATFDSALIGYAVAIVALTYAVVARYSRWLAMPSTRRYWRRGWGLFLSWDNFRRLPGLFPRAVFGQLIGQGFIRRRGMVRWIGHQCLFWGVILATFITFPLVFGWLLFLLEPGTEDTYRIFVFGFPTATFDSSSFLGWSIFRGLAYAAVLVIAGCLVFLWRRFRDRAAVSGQRFDFDMVPLLMLLVISVTGLMLTASASFLAGAYYGFLVITHMATVVAALVFIPFGKFFHVLQRPASVGIQMYTEINERAGARPCARCGEGVASDVFIADLQATLGELGQRYDLPIDGTAGPDGATHLTELCPRCKRVRRGEGYFAANGGGF